MSNSDITVTLHDPSTGRSESIPISDTLMVEEVLDLGKALLGLPEETGNSGGQWGITKYGKPLGTLTSSLAQVGVRNGDLLVFMKTKPRNMAPIAGSGSSAATGAGGASGRGGLDFSSLLGVSSAPATAVAGNSGDGGLDFSGLLGGLATNNDNPSPVYYAGMSLEEALHSNPHPKAIVKVLQQHSHLFKEFNYHMPVLARKIQQAPSYETAVEIWRKDMVRNSIRSAAAKSQTFHKERRFNCSIDLLDSKLKFRLGGNILETPFLHEKDLDESKGGTKGFDATKANQELEELQRQYHEREQKEKQGNSGSNDDHMEE
eukprot:jgi/Psemu1/254214/estExt_Genewise1Plus.C_930063